MKLFLTSSTDQTTHAWIKHLGRDPHSMKLTFITTAAEVEKGDKQWLYDDRQTLVTAGFDVTDYTVAGKSKDDVTAMLNNTDMVFVSGGNVFYLLQEMRLSGFADLIKGFVHKGLLYGGSSAGSIVAGPDLTLAKTLDDPKMAPKLKDYKALGLTDVVVLPHWGSENFRKHYEDFGTSGYTMGQKVVLLTNDQYLMVEDDHYQIMSI